MPISTPQDVLSFWFGLDDVNAPHSPEVSAKRSGLWWGKSESQDAEIRDRFLPTLRAVATGDANHWLQTKAGTVAAIIVLDQFSRNMFRDTARMYTHDGQARRLSLSLLASGAHRELPYYQRVFAYMPLEHSEDRGLQRRCEDLFRFLRDEHRATAFAGSSELYLDFARRHRAIVERFGRFPHRNAILGRETTPEEAAFLEQPGSSF